MLKSAGVLLLSAVILLAGVFAARYYREHIGYTAELEALIRRLGELIECERAELSVLYGKCGAYKLLDKTGFTTLAAELGWEGAVGRLCSSAPVGNETAAILYEFGTLLGKTDAAGQKSNCELTASRLAGIVSAGRAELASRLKLCRTLSVSAALTVLLLFL